MYLNILLCGGDTCLVIHGSGHLRYPNRLSMCDGDPLNCFSNSRGVYGIGDVTGILGWWGAVELLLVGGRKRPAAQAGRAGIWRARRKQSNPV